MTEVGKTDPSNRRWHALDVIRGAAMLGIVVMNVPGYALPSASYVNPAAQGPLTGLDWIAWACTHVFAEQKFMTLFSLLFGVGVMLAAERRSAHGVSPWPDFLRRSAFLLGLGVAHAYLIWYGDVLTTYALAGVVAMTMRKAGTRALLAMGVCLLALPSLYSVALGFTFDSFPEPVKLEIVQAYTPSAEAIAREQAAYLSGWLGQMRQRAADAWILQTFLMATVFFWRAAGLMLIGMALYRIGYVDASRPAADYRRLLNIALPAGIALILVGIYCNEKHAWQAAFSMFLGSQFNYWGSVAVALGYLAVLNLVVRQRRLQKLQRALADTGRMTLSLYLLMSIVGTFVFYGHGLSQYDQVGRLGLLLITPLFWIIELIAVRSWRSQSGAGPLEMLMGWACTTRAVPFVPATAGPKVVRADRGQGE